MSDESGTPVPAPGVPAAAAPPPPEPPQPPTPAQAPYIPEPSGPKPGGRRHGGMAFGIALVFIGAVLLAAQFAPGVSIWALWPIFILAAGAVQAVTPDEEGWSVNRFFDGLVTIAIGLVLLGCTLGYLPWSIWWRILWLWPVLLISAGIGIIGRAIHQRWLGAVGSMLVIAALAWAALSTYQQAPMPSLSFSSNAGAANTLSFSEPVGATKKASLALDVGAATVKLTDGVDLVAVEASSPWGKPTASVARSGDSADVEVGLQQSGVVVLPTGNQAEVDLELARGVLWDAKVNSGATSMDLDFSDIDVSGIEINTGASDVGLKLGEPISGATRVEVSSGASSFKLRVPEGEQVRVSFETALVGRSMGGLASTGSGTYETTGFNEGLPFWDIVIKSAVGDVSFETY